MGEREGEYLTCENCGDEFYVTPSRLKQTREKGHEVRFCSMECYNKNRKGEDNPFYGESHSEDSIEKMRSHPNRPKFPEGDENPTYQQWEDDPNEVRQRFFELYKEGFRDKKIADKLDIAQSTVYRWRRKLELDPNGKQTGDGLRFKRDQLLNEIGECERCGWDEDIIILEIHHIDRNRTNNDKSNLELLCPNCHRLEHKDTGTGPYSS